MISIYDTFYQVGYVVVGLLYAVFVNDKMFRKLNNLCYYVAIRAASVTVRPLINSINSTPVGKLVTGNGFSDPDFL